jgi:glyoxylase-like metal-dependent hydrolase (beta-lactamase superfamily II)
MNCRRPMSARSCEGSCVLANEVAARLPAGVVCLERGWLSANNIILKGGHGPVAIIDTGYSSHASQTLALVKTTLGTEALDLILNTHLHSDHCGGNALLQAHFPDSRTLVPPGLAAHVREWDPVALSYTATGQFCPQFRCDGVLRPGETIRLGRWDWEVHGAPGHDPHSVVLFEPVNALLVSADALWQKGFGIVFPELDGNQAFDDVDLTFNLIEQLAPRVVIPGHGAVFMNVNEAIEIARKRLDGFVQSPRRHARHAIKVLLKFKLLEVQRIGFDDFMAWATAMPYVHQIQKLESPGVASDIWLTELCNDLCRSGAAEMVGTDLLNR